MKTPARKTIVSWFLKHNNVFLINNAYNNKVKKIHRKFLNYFVKLFFI